jgi:hypothetical protein
MYISESARVDRETEKVMDFEVYVGKIWDDAENEREKIIGILNQVHCWRFDLCLL